MRQCHCRQQPPDHCPHDSARHCKEVLNNKAAKDMEVDIPEEEEEEEEEDPALPVQHTTLSMLMDYTTAMKDVLCSSTAEM